MAWNLPGSKHPSFVDITGKRPHPESRVTALSYLGHGLWLCRCDCGTEFKVLGKSLRTGNTKSCGCFKLESLTTNPRALKHGRSPEWQSWSGMIRRCHEPRATGYKRYGGRGITVCDRWRGEDGLANFIADMGPRPKGYELDRIDNDQGYFKENCRWGTRRQQARNRRDTRLITLNGKTQCLKDWLAEFGILDPTFRYRVKAGWTIERALTTPARQ